MGIHAAGESEVPNRAVQMHFLPNRAWCLATSAKPGSPPSAEMAAGESVDSVRVVGISRLPPRGLLIALVMLPSVGIVVQVHEGMLAEASTTGGTATESTARSHTDLDVG